MGGMESRQAGTLPAANKVRFSSVEAGRRSYATNMRGAGAVQRCVLVASAAVLSWA